MKQFSKKKKKKQNVLTSLFIWRPEVYASYCSGELGFKGLGVQASGLDKVTEDKVVSRYLLREIGE